MTRQEVDLRVAELRASHPARDSHQWIARPGENGTWSVVQIPIAASPPLTTETRADERPPTGDDPRPNTWRDLGGPWVGGA